MRGKSNYLITQVLPPVIVLLVAAAPRADLSAAGAVGRLGIAAQ
jgi:hypothetical protein